MPLPVHALFNDPYARGGLAEKKHTFVTSQQLEERLGERPLVSAELGFGIGLAFLALYLAAMRTGGTFRFISFELYPLAWGDIAAVWREELVLAEALTDELEGVLDAVAAWPAVLDGWQRYELPHALLELGAGDARLMLPTVDFLADAWFLDGHSPEKNPELWEAGLLMEVGRHTLAGGTFGTYSCAAIVREGLTAAGFGWEKVPGFGVKRRMLRGRMTD